MSLPKVTVLFANGNLLQSVAAIDGIAGLVCTGNTADLQGSVLQIYSLEDAVSKGITQTAETSAYRHIKEFYQELGGNQLLYVLLLPNTVTMAEMLDSTNNECANKIVKAAGGTIRLLGITKSPAADYDGGTAFLDQDVSAAITASKSFGDYQLTKLSPLRILVEGRVANEAVNATYAPSSADVDYTGVVLGGSLADGSASVGLALGRAVKYAAHIKLGKVANGALNLTKAYIGSNAVETLSNLETLHDMGFISFMQHPQKSGYYFGIDHMTNTADYRLLAYGRIVDKAAVLAIAVLVNQLEGEVDVDDDGRIDEISISHLEAIVSQQIQANMGDQISGFTIVIDPDQDIINTNTLAVTLGVQPKGYTSFITLTIGLQTTSNS